MEKPTHIGIIMDGNGRWGVSNFKNRIKGHRKGVDVLIQTILTALEQDIKYLSVFAFSTENWKREDSEIKYLMKMPELLYKIWQKNFKDHDVKFKIIGQTSELNPNVQKTIQKIEEGTKEKNKLTVNVCFNYGGQQDILQAMQKIAQEVKEEKVNVSEIKKEMIEERLLTGNTPPIDLVIRTSGEFRISNFMLWQISYAEFYISNYNWPDFTKEEFKKAIGSYHQRERRYGGTN